ncbi:major facilitator superfamily domain-containing protein [Aspergillus floccosus]
MEHREKDEPLVPAHEKFTEEAAAERQIWISFYLANLEVTIVSTSLIAITNDLKGFDKTGWINTAYLSTFTGFMSVWTKVGNIIGRKKTFIAADLMFLLFSLGCGLSQTADQLVICRAFQGVGGAGVYPLGILCIYEIAPKPRLPIYGGTLAIAVALASLTGPIIGGVLAQNSAWRWVFYINRVERGRATFVSGCPWNVVVVYLTQRLQILTKVSPLMAGVRLIPYSAVSTIFTSVANLASLKGHIPFVYFALAGSILHIVGMALLSCLPENNEFPAAGYGYEVIAGAGIGTTIGILILAVPYVVETRDLAIATGAMNQCRFLGGAIGLSIASNILSDKLHAKLDGTLPSEELDRLLKAVSIIPTLPTDIQALVEKAFAEGYTTQFRVMIAFTAVQVPASLLMLRRRRQYVVE